MPIIRLETLILAPPEVCFDLARNIAVHTRSTAHTRERAIAGVTSGLIGLGESVTWEAVHFHLTLRLTSKITQFDQPRSFTDEMVRGPFRWFVHRHDFPPVAADQTLMIDTFDFASPGGPIGWLANVLFLTRYMRNLLDTRAQFLKQLAELESAPIT